MCSALSADFSQVFMVSGVSVKFKLDYPDCMFQTYRGTNLSYDILCEPTISYITKRKREIISAVIILSTKTIDNQHRYFCVLNKCAQEKSSDKKMQRRRLYIFKYKRKETKKISFIILRIIISLLHIINKS